VKHVKRMAAGLLVLVLALGLALPAQAVKWEDPQGPGGDPWEVDEVHPVIIVHGIGQSEVFLYDEETGRKATDADGNPIQGWPPKIDINGLIPKLIFPLLASVLLQHDICLTSTLRGLAKEILSVFEMKENGRPKLNMQVERWHRYGGGAPTSLKDLPEAQREAAYHNIPLRGMADVIPEENMYYFAYDSFGNLEDIVGELYELIQDILAKPEHAGAGKVNIIPISLGGTIMNGLVDYYKEENIAGQLNNVVYVIAALDGSNLVGDLFTRQLATDNESLYRTMLPGLVEGYLGYLLNLAVRLLPKRLAMKVVDAVIDGAVGGVVSRCTMIWALLPHEYYPAASAEWLSDPSMDLIRPQVERYHGAQERARDNIVEMRENGVHCYAIVDYNHPMYNFVASAKRVNSDGLLQMDSPSLGGYSAGVNVPLSAEYKAAHPGGIYDGLDGMDIVDAAAGDLPDYTWYFKDQDHERTGHCDVVMNLTLRLACGAADPSVRDMPEWPQFNHGRNGDRYKDMLRQAKAVNRAGLAAEDIAALDAAIALVQAVVDSTISRPTEDAQAEQSLRAIMEKIGAWAPQQGPGFWEKAGDKICWFLSEAAWYTRGPRGFFDPVWRIWCD